MKKYAITALIITSLLITAYLVFINKINISSDIKDAFYQQLRKTLSADPKVREPFELYQDSIKAMKEVVTHKIKLFDDADKAKFYSL